MSWVLFAFGALVDFVSEDVFCEGKSDGVVKTGQQLSERLVLATHEHGDGGMLVSGGGYAACRVDDADGDFAILDEVGEVGQEIRDRVAGWFWTLLQAASWFTRSRLRAKFQGKSSSMRQIGCSAMCVSRCRR